ncbi:dnaj-class molecular chaperone [hydrocarbon metagenome]|uniref:Dnaj-class molecular chaperone n=1 Tax=hydrocarbon metagenome TaxID=938273 RepID=A0A0W8FFB7_9ZZZZ|nr:J domain-containing protein [Methanomicrobiaceae archaeon]
MAASTPLSIREAADILGIADRASINEIRSRYRALVREWHPDISPHAPDDTHDEMVRLNEAYSILIDYCMQYEIPLRPEDIRLNAGEQPMDAWMERYGDDPIWGPRRPRSHPHRD